VSFDNPILVVGAGLGGLTAALALARRNIPVLACEQAPELGEVGAGITMWPNMTVVLEHLGLREEMERLGFVPAHMGQRHFETGELMRRTIVGSSLREKYDAPQYFMHRADLHQMLVDAVRAIVPDAILLDHMLTGLQQDADGVDAIFANGRRIRGSALIGADGIHSVVRSTLFGQDSPRWTGVVAWRGIVPMELLPEFALDPTSCTWPGPDHYFVRYPVRAGQLMNYVAFARADVEWRGESWRQHSTVAEVKEQYAGWEPRVQAVIDATPPDACFKWALYDRDPINTWSVGRIALLGDAAHPSLPFLGQGASMAVEDGIVVARCLQAFPDIPMALRRYEELRKPRAHWVQLQSRENVGRQFSNPDPLYKSGEAARVNEMFENFRRYDAGSIPLEVEAK
jgi:salicylate hydroxylase